MSTEQDPRTTQDSSSPMAGAPSMAAASPSRRRALLKGLGKGSALVAASVPIRSLATTSVTADKHLCSISGVQSGVRSNTTGMPTCGGKSLAYYSNLANWPKNGSNQPVVNNGTSDFLTTATFAGVFGAGSATPLTTLMTGTTDEAHWIVALLNAKVYAGVGNFPYTNAEVRAQYNSAQQASAIAFYKTYMEQLP